jgi:branched-chain amino acid transport system permease protein
VGTLIGTVAQGVALGAIYSLVAVGFVIIYKATGVFNFAHGQFMVLGAYFAYVSISWVGLPFAAGIAVTLVITGAVGLVVYAALIRPLLGEAIFAPVMITIGLSIVLDSIISITTKGNTYLLPTPVPVHGVSIPGTTTRVSNYSLIAIVVAAVFFVLIASFFRWSGTGRDMRAAAENPHLASYAGVSLGFIFSVAWALAAVAAAIAGIAQASSTLISPDIGSVALRAFPAALLGGLDSVMGAALGGVLIGIIEMLGSQYVGSDTRDVFPYVVLLVALMVRPYGLLGSRQVDRI